MTTVLAIMAKAETAQVMNAIASAAHLVDRICLVVAPDDPLTAIGPLVERAFGKPCTILAEPWRGHAATRTATMRHAEHIADWVVMLDADDTFAPGASLPPELDADAYEIPIDCTFDGGRWRWIRHGHLMRSGCGFQWTGTAGLHEVLDTRGRRTDRWDGLAVCVDQRVGYSSTRAGGRTYQGDAHALDVHLGMHPTDTRAAFYHAYSLRDAGNLPAAYAAFVHRAGMAGGFLEETLWAKLWAAKLAPYVGLTQDEVLLRHQEAIDFAPERAEPLRQMALLRRGIGEPEQAISLEAAASQLPYPAHARSYVDVDAYAPWARAAAGIR